MYIRRQPAGGILAAASTLDSFPGRPNNPVGFAAAPGFTSLTASSGPFTSGTPGSPTVINFKDFDAGISSTNLDANWLVFNGCRFQSNNQGGNNGTTGGTGAQNIIFNYCSFTPRTTFYIVPPGGGVWPSAAAGGQTTTFIDDVNCTAGTKGYQFGFDFHNLTDGPITFDHCDFWGFGNAVNFIGHTAQVILRDCQIHDSANTSPNAYHNDGPGYLNGGTPPQNILIDHCTIASIGTTNALAMQAATSAYVGIKVRRTFFSGFNVCIDMCHDVLGSTGLEFTDNVIGTDLPWVNGPLSGASLFVTPGSPTNLWRRNKFRVLPGTSTIAGQQFTWTSADDGKFLYPDGTLHATDYAG